MSYSFIPNTDPEIVLLYPSYDDENDFNIATTALETPIIGWAIDSTTPYPNSTHSPEFIGDPICYDDHDLRTSAIYNKRTGTITFPFNCSLFEHDTKGFLIEVNRKNKLFQAERAKQT